MVHIKTAKVHIFIKLLNKQYYIDFLKIFWKKIKENIDLFFLVFSITLSKSFVVGKLDMGRFIELRIEDFVIFILAVIWLIKLIKSEKTEFLKLKETPFFGLICAWLIIGFLSIILNWFWGNYNVIKGAFYFLKEIEFFFIYFYVYWRIKKMNSAKFLINLWILFMAFNVAFIFFQIFNRTHFGEYCLAAISERGVFPSGAFFLIPFIFLFNILFYHTFNLNISLIKKILFGIVIFSIIFGVFGSASKTNAAALFFSLLLTIILFFFKTRNLKLFFILLLVTFLAIIIFFSFSKNLRCASRINISLFPNALADSYMKARWYSATKDQLAKILIQPPRTLIFGMGKGYGETHNQYLRNLVEGGVIGSIAFLILMFSIIKTSYIGFLIGFLKSKNNFLIGLSAGFLISTLIMLFMGMSTEPFLVVKPSEVFWFFAALTMAVLAIEKKQNLP